MAQQPSIKSKTRSIVTEDDDNCSEFSVITVEDDNAEDLEGADEAVRPLSAYLQPSEAESELGDISSEVTASVIDSEEAKEVGEQMEAVQNGMLLMEPVELVDNQEAQLPTANPDEPEWNPMILSGYMTTSSVVDMMNKMMTESRSHGSVLSKIELLLGDLKSQYDESSEMKEVEIQRLRQELQKSKERMRELIRADAKLHDSNEMNKRLVAQLQEQCQLNKSLREELDETQDELQQTRVELANQRTIVKVLQEDQNSQQKNFNEVNKGYDEVLNKLYREKTDFPMPEKKKTKYRRDHSPSDHQRIRRIKNPVTGRYLPSAIDYLGEKPRCCRRIPETRTGSLFASNPFTDKRPDPIAEYAKKFKRMFEDKEYRDHWLSPGRLGEPEDLIAFKNSRPKLWRDREKRIEKATRCLRQIDDEVKEQMRRKVMAPFLDDFSVQPGTSKNAGPFHVCACLRAFATEGQLTAHKFRCNAETFHRES